VDHRSRISSFVMSPLFFPVGCHALLVWANPWPPKMPTPRDPRARGEPSSSASGSTACRKVRDGRTGIAPKCGIPNHLSGTAGGSLPGQGQGAPRAVRRKRMAGLSMHLLYQAVPRPSARTTKAGGVEWCRAHRSARSISGIHPVQCRAWDGKGTTEKRETENGRRKTGPGSKKTGGTETGQVQ
jgi:hypothetical protein